MKKSIIIFAMAAVLSVGMIVYGCVFVDSRIGAVTLTEETVTGNRDAAEGLAAGFRADSAEDLHWTGSFDYGTDRTESSFKRGEMEKSADTLVYDDIRFTGWSAVPFYTQLKYDPLGDLQDQKIHAFYQGIQQRVMEDAAEEEGKVKLGDYLDFYPVSFRFQFGSRIYNSDNALTGLKVYDARGKLSEEDGTAYDEDVELYAALNKNFRIPVIGNEYQEYRVSKVQNYDYRKSLGYKTEVKKPLGAGEDIYEFDPVMAVQEENLNDGRTWTHPDIAKAGSGGLEEAASGKKAAEYGLKNRMLFIVNNRTAKGAPVDVSQIRDGYGVYELPIEASATATIRKGKKSFTVPSPKPLPDEMAMVYPLDKKAEYVEMSLSDDHRYLAVFSVKDGSYFVELVDADTWTSDGPARVFPASEKMTYAWGGDGTLAVTNHKGHVAVFTRTDNDKEPYGLLYRGKIGDGFDEAFFDSEMVTKKHSRARYQYCVDRGLAVAAKDGKAALVQNLLAGSAAFNIRNAALECAVIDRSGVIYRGRLKSNIVDLDYDMGEDEMQAVRDLQGGAVMKYIIEPVRNENWVKWNSRTGQ